MRLHDQSASSKIETLRRLLIEHSGVLVDHFLVVTETAVRLAGEVPPADT